MAFLTISIPSAELLGETNVAELLNPLGQAIAKAMRDRIRAGIDAEGRPFPQGMDFVDSEQFVRSIRSDKVKKPKPGGRPILAVSIGPRGRRREAKKLKTITGGRGRGKDRSAKRGGTRVAKNIDIAMFWLHRTRGQQVPLIGLRPADEAFVRDFLWKRLKLSITVRIR